MFMFFGRKHVETGLNCSHEPATFLKYHMPLKQWINRISAAELKTLSWYF